MLDDWMSSAAIESEIDALTNGKYANLPSGQLQSKVKHLSQMIDKLADMGYFDKVDKLERKLKDACSKRGIRY